MPNCGAITSKGTQCKIQVHRLGEKCLHHRELGPDDPTCSICLSPMRTRNVRTLDCNHTFHKACLERWKRTGNYTCPICRKDFDPPQYKITIQVEFLGEPERPSIQQILQNASIDGLNRTLTFPRIDTEIQFESENIESIRDILRDLGVLDADISHLVRRLSHPPEGTLLF